MQEQKTNNRLYNRVQEYKEKKQKPFKGQSMESIQTEESEIRTLKPSTQFLLGPQRERDIGKKTLVLDLDETLIHSSFEPLANADIIFDLHL